MQEASRSGHPETACKVLVGGFRAQFMIPRRAGSVKEVGHPSISVVALRPTISPC